MLARHQRLHHETTTPSSTNTASEAQQSSASDYRDDPSEDGQEHPFQHPEAAILHEELPAAAPDSAAGCDDVVQDLSGFLCTIGVNLDLDFNDMYQGQEVSRLPSPYLPVSAPIDPPPACSRDVVDCQTSSQEDLTPEAVVTNIPVVSMGDGESPSPKTNEKQYSHPPDDFHELKPFSQPWKLTEDQRRELGSMLKPYSAAMGQFMLPSRLSLTRYIAGFMDDFIHHHPFVHKPTFRLENYARNPEMILALLAVGAQFRFERARALSLYRAGRSIILERMKSGELSRLSTDRYADSSSSSLNGSAVHIMGAILLLAKFASWHGDPDLLSESREYQPLLAGLCRGCGLDELEDDDGDHWLAWSRKETARRTQLCVFVFLNLQSVALGFAPTLLSNEINLRLPTTCDEWFADNQRAWLAARDRLPTPVYFQDALGRVLCEQEGPAPTTTPFGNFIVMHALLQRLVLLRQLSAAPLFPPQAVRLPGFETVLHRWREAWRRVSESVLDPKTPRGSLSLSATSLLGLAHVRHNFDLGWDRKLHTLSPEVIARAAYASPQPQRGSHLVHALVHSAHALSFPAQLGIEYLSHLQVFSWSIQHVVCFFDCSVFLSKWLWKLSADWPLRSMDRTYARTLVCVWTDIDSNAMPDYEQRVVDWLVAMVAEVQASLGEVADDDTHLGLPPILAQTGQVIQPLGLRHLAVSIVTTFSQMFRDCNSGWPMTRLIGESLEFYAGLLQGSLESP